MSDELAALAADAYVYGYPLVFDLHMVGGQAELGMIKPAPVNNLPDFYLVANPISRYSIGDRTAGLHRNDDGTLTIVIQHERPADTSNWLPAPAAPFRPLMRLYQPQPAILDGKYEIAPITKAAG